MKRFLTLSNPSASIVTIGYVTTFVCLLVGAHIFLTGKMDINILAAIVGMVLGIATFIIKLTGWTLIGFIPVGTMVGLRCFQAIAQGTLSRKHNNELFLLMEIALAVGMAGTIWAFIQTGLNYSTNGSGDPHSSFMSILIGLGSTFAALMIILKALVVIYLYGNKSTEE